MSDAEAVFAFLEERGIAFRAASHAPAYTMADCAAVDRTLGALTVKNIFLTTKNQKRCWLCITRPDARFRTADISKQIGSSRLSFAPEEMLFARLRCHGGSASPMGLIFPEAAGVGLIVDAALRGRETLAFHPCDNTRTLAMSGADFFGRFLPAVEVETVDVEIHDFIE
ncbi:MAG: prolyl-tRNA synthetase associated domain-containing protein [Clostridia bacterium]|nr:prolyl-tRNA synthetase associated domain-containing protein [Clostridia bacterium]